MNSLFSFALILIGLYLLLCTLLYIGQEKLLFFPDKLPKGYTFSFPQAFEERTFKLSDATLLSAILFPAKNSQGLVFFLHGNAGAINSWGYEAEVYLRNHYDVLFLDYRGYGKSEGKISSEKQLLGDAKEVYERLREEYQGRNLILAGTSLGTGVATQLAAHKSPDQLILSAPYFSLKKLILEKYPLLPGWIIRYPLDSYSYLSQVKCPIYLFHGSKDALIPLDHAQRLKKIQPKSHLIIVEDYGHNNLSGSEEYQQRMDEILGR